MRICLVSGEFPPMQGGVGDYTREMARAYASLGHEVLVITTRPEEIAAPQETATSESYRVAPVIARWNWRGVSDVLALVRDWAPQVVNVQYQAAAYAMQPEVHLLPLRLRHLSPAPKVVVTYHDLRVPYLFPKAGWLRWGALLALARWSDAVLVTNVADEARLAPYRFLPRLARIPIGSNIAPTPPAGYDRAAWRARFGLGPEALLLAYFGFLNESKGGETLIRALARLQNDYHLAAFRLLMIGGRVGTSDPTNAAYAERIEALIKQLGLTEQVLWTGFLSSEEVSASLLAADVAVLPYRDGVSLRRGSLMAALAHGLPVVSTRYPEPKKQIADPAGWWSPVEFQEGDNILLVPPDDDTALARAIARLATFPELRAHVSAGAQLLATHFGWDEIARKSLELYHEIGC